MSKINVKLDKKAKDVVQKTADIGGGVEPTGTYNVTENGIYDIKQYANVDVNVSVTPVDDGYRTYSEFYNMFNGKSLNGEKLVQFMDKYGLEILDSYDSQKMWSIYYIQNNSSSVASSIMLEPIMLFGYKDDSNIVATFVYNGYDSIEGVSDKDAFIEAINNLADLSLFIPSEQSLTMNNFVKFKLVMQCSGGGDPVLVDFNEVLACFD